MVRLFGSWNSWSCSQFSIFRSTVTSISATSCSKKLKSHSDILVKCLSKEPWLKVNSKKDMSVFIPRAEHFSFLSFCGLLCLLCSSVCSLHIHSSILLSLTYQNPPFHWIKNVWCFGVNILRVFSVMSHVACLTVWQNEACSNVHHVPCCTLLLQCNCAFIDHVCSIWICLAISTLHTSHLQSLYVV